MAAIYLLISPPFFLLSDDRPPIPATDRRNIRCSLGALSFATTPAQRSPLKRSIHKESRFALIATAAQLCERRSITPCADNARLRSRSPLRANVRPASARGTCCAVDENIASGSKVGPQKEGRERKRTRECKQHKNKIIGFLQIQRSGTQPPSDATKSTRRRITSENLAERDEVQRGKRSRERGAAICSLVVCSVAGSVCHYHDQQY